MSDNDLQREKDGAAHQTDRKSWLLGALEYITQTGLAEFVLRLGTHALMLALILLFAWVLRGFYLLAQAEKPLSRTASASTLPTPTPVPPPPTPTPRPTPTPAP